MSAEDREILQAVANDNGAHLAGFPGMKTAMSTVARVLLEMARENERHKKGSNRTIDIQGGAE